LVEQETLNLKVAGSSPARPIATEAAENAGPLRTVTNPVDVSDFLERLEAVGGGGGRLERQGWETAEELIDGFKELEKAEREIVRTRWLNEVMLYHHLWKRQRFAYYALRAPMIIGATTVPVLASLSVPKIATVLVGLAVAILTAFDGLFRLGSRWRQARFAEERLSSEGWQFLELAGENYEKAERRAAYKAFLRRIEKLNEQLSMMRLELFDEKDPGEAPASG
jgi:hypothetical protein